MTITIDRDNDEVRIDCPLEDREYRMSPATNPIIIKARRTNRIAGWYTSDIKTLLEEVLNLLNVPGTILRTQDDGRNHIIGEW